MRGQPTISLHGRRHYGAARVWSVARRYYGLTLRSAILMVLSTSLQASEVFGMFGERLQGQLVLYGAVTEP